MTGTYEWNPMPHIADVRCPSCSGLAKFEFAEIVRIELKKDVDFFKENSLFDYEMFKDSCGHKWHAAIYYAGLHGNSTDAIQDLPQGYQPSNWNHSRFLSQNRQPQIGSLKCLTCQTAKKHTLNWPEEAYYSIEYKGSVLWAFHKESAIELRDYIASTDRNEDKYKWRGFLLHIPTTFKKHNARDRVVKSLNRLLNV